eukprot:SAG22_NODE_306_length_12671_cov_14.743239_4_plen_93_part_00
MPRDGYAGTGTGGPFQHTANRQRLQRAAAARAAAASLLGDVLSEPPPPPEGASRTPPLLLARLPLPLLLARLPHRLHNLHNLLTCGLAWMPV